MRNRSIGKTLDTSLPSIGQKCQSQIAHPLLSCNECDLPLIEEDERRHHLKEEHDKQQCEQMNQETRTTPIQPAGTDASEKAFPQQLEKWVLTIGVTCDVIVTSRCNSVTKR